MYYSCEFVVQDFPFWSGAADRIKDLTFDQVEQLGLFIEEVFSDSTPTMTQINDFVWYEWDYICESLNFFNDESEF